MGLFGRKRGPDGGSKRFGHGAFADQDVDDARRGHPASALDGLAPQMGMEFSGNLQPGAFLATLPTWPDYIFNGFRGVSSTGRLAMVAHELCQIDAHNGSVRNAGRFVDHTESLRFGTVEVGGIEVNSLPNEPFVERAIWVPTTTAHVRAPETLRLPVLRITRSSSFIGEPDHPLDAAGLPGFCLRQGEHDARLAGQVVDAVRPWLGTRPNDAHVDLRVRYGVVALTVNGYRSDADDLRHVLAVADGIAGVLATLTPAPSGVPFTTFGPVAGTVTYPPGFVMTHPMYSPAFAEAARLGGLHNEDPSHVMMMLPRCPIPGAPSGVLAGPIPGTPLWGRLVWYDQGGRTTGTLRAGLIVPARPGAVTPIGGQIDRARAMYVEVVDGVASCWRQTRNTSGLEPEALVADAVAVLDAGGLAAPPRTD